MKLREEQGSEGPKIKSMLQLPVTTAYSRSRFFPLQCLESLALSLSRLPWHYSVVAQWPSLACPSLHSRMRNRCFFRQKVMQRMQKETPGSRYLYNYFRPESQFHQ